MFLRRIAEWNSCCFDLLPTDACLRIVQFAKVFLPVRLLDSRNSVDLGELRKARHCSVLRSTVLFQVSDVRQDSMIYVIMYSEQSTFANSLNHVSFLLVDCP